MMLSTRLVCSLVVCMTIGSVVMGLPTPQFRFGMPAHFAFRTVHTPIQFGQQPAQAPNTFFFRQPRLTSMATKALEPQPEVALVEQVQPVLATEETHVPVFVPVQNDFQGDSVVVSSDDLVNMGLTGALENADGTVDPAPVPMDEGMPVEELSLAPVADIQTDLLDAVVPVEELAAGPLSIADDAFVLTASEVQPEPVELVSPVDTSVIEPEFIPQEIQPVELEVIPQVEPEFIPEEIQPVEPVVFQTFSPTTTVSPFQTETFKAYNDFMNTWIQLASVNLNRPDLLELVNVLPTVDPPLSLLQAESVPLEIQEPVLPETQPELVEVVEAVQPVEIAEEIPMIEETLPVETVTEDIISEFTPSDVTTEVPFVDVTTELATDIMVEEVTQVAETIPEVTFENIQPEVVEPTDIISEILPETTQPEIIEQSAAALEPSAAVVEQDIATNIIPDTPAQQPAVPAHFNTVPTYTSRGRLSGFRYSFAHVPQRGTFFLNSIAG